MEVVFIVGAKLGQEISSFAELKNTMRSCHVVEINIVRPYEITGSFSRSWHVVEIIIARPHGIIGSFLRSWHAIEINIAHSHALI